MHPFSLADDLLLMTPETSHPRDLPDRYGRVIRDLERLLQITQTLAVVAGGWAVWKHGFAGRVTQDVDVVVPRDKIEQLMQTSTLCGFDGLQPPTGRWPKLVHRETQIDVDLLPEGGIPGTSSHPAPMAIQHPRHYRAAEGSLEYISLGGLIELKLGASRAKDIADIIELIKTHRAHQAIWQEVTDHIANTHAIYSQRFRELIVQAQEEE